MLDVRAVRGDPDRLKATLARRGVSYDQAVDELLAADDLRRAAVTEADGLKGVRNPETLQRLMQLSGDDATAWRSVDPRPGFAGWTDDHASILPIINFEAFLPRGTR